MSWQSYVDDQLIKAGLSKAAIIGLDGSTWASKNITIPAAEAKQLVANFNAPGTAQSNGITVGGVKHLTVKADDKSIYGKKGTGGIVTVKTAQCVIVGFYDDKIQPGVATNIVEKLADYLKENGY